MLPYMVKVKVNLFVCKYFPKVLLPVAFHTLVITHEVIVKTCFAMTTFRAKFTWNYVML